MKKINKNIRPDFYIKNLINKYLGNNAAALFYDLLEILRYKLWQKRKIIKSMNNCGQYPRLIEIETINRCNNTCSFCPVNKLLDKRKEEYMDSELFKKIIIELQAINFNGHLSFHSNNEPLLDNRIFDFIAFARPRLTKSKFVMFTNGILLNEEKFLFLANNLDVLVIDNYNDNLKLIKPVEKIYNKYKKNFDDRVSVSLRYRNEVLTNRGGNAQNRKSMIKSINKFLCGFVYAQMVIRPSGKISLCCFDAYGENTIGDLNYETIREIWNGELYKNLRTSMMGGRKNIPFCSK